MNDQTLPAPVTEKPSRSVFGRRHDQAITTAGNGLNGHYAHTAPSHQGQAQRGFMTDFHFGTWFKLHWVDLLTMAAMGAVGLGVYEADPAPSRSFPVL